MRLTVVASSVASVASSVATVAAVASAVAPVAAVSAVASPPVAASVAVLGGRHAQQGENQQGCHLQTALQVVAPHYSLIPLYKPHMERKWVNK